MLHVYVSVPSVIFLRFSVPWSQNLILYTALFISYFCAYYVTYFLQELMQQYLLQKKRTRHQTCMITNFDCQILTIYKTSEIFQLIVMVKVKSWWLNEKKNCIDSLSNNLFLRIQNMIDILRFLKGGLMYHQLAF